MARALTQAELNAIANQPFVSSTIQSSFGQDTIKDVQLGSTFTQQIKSPATSQTLGSTITPKSLTPTTPMPLVSPNTVPVYDVSNLQVPELTLTPQEQKASSLSSQLGSLYNSLVGKSAYQTQQNQIYGVNTAQAAIQDLSAQLTGIKNEAAAIPLQLQQGAAERGVTTPMLAAQQNSRLRTNAIAALGVSTLLEAAQGRLANAQALANQAVAQKYDPILERIEAMKMNLQLIYDDPLTSLQDKNRALQQQAIQDAKAEAVSLQKESAKEIWNIATTAASNGQNFQPSGIYTNLATTLQAISAAPTKEAALQIAVSTGLVQDVVSASASSGPTSVQEYEYAKSQGYTGSYIQYQTLKSTQFGTEGSGGGGSKSSTTGADLADAYAAIEGGADPIEVKRAFLSDHPTSSATWDSYFKDEGGEIEYPSIEEPVKKKSGLFGWGFLGL